MYSVFFVLLSKTLVFAAFCASLDSLVWKYWYLYHFLRFWIIPAKDVETKKDAAISTALFFPILGNSITLKTEGGNALRDAYMSDPDSVQKARQQSDVFRGPTERASP